MTPPFGISRSAAQRATRSAAALLIDPLAMRQCSVGVAWVCGSRRKIFSTFCCFVYYTTDLTDLLVYVCCQLLLTAWAATLLATVVNRSAALLWAA